MVCSQAVDVVGEDSPLSTDIEKFADVGVTIAGGGGVVIAGFGFVLVVV